MGGIYTSDFFGKSAEGDVFCGIEVERKNRPKEWRRGRFLYDSVHLPIRKAKYFKNRPCIFILFDSTYDWALVAHSSAFGELEGGKTARNAEGPERWLTAFKKDIYIVKVEGGLPGEDVQFLGQEDDLTEFLAEAL